MDTLTHNGREYRVTIEHDSDMGAPWKEHDGHGTVRESRTRHRERMWKTKRPGERPLNDPDRNQLQYLYDWQAATKTARADGWGISEESVQALQKKLGRIPTRGEYFEEATRQDFEYLRGWLNESWHYAVVTVSCGDYSASLGGVEYGLSDEYADEVARELAGEVEHQINEAREKAQGRLCDARQHMRAAVRTLQRYTELSGAGADVYDSLVYAMKQARKECLAAVSELRELAGVQS